MFRPTLTLSAALIAALAGAPPLGAQIAAGTATLPADTITAYPFPRVSDPTFARLHPAAAREVDSLAAQPISARVVRRLRRIDDSLAVAERALAARLTDRLAERLPSAPRVAAAAPLAAQPGPVLEPERRAWWRSSWRTRAAWAAVGYAAGRADGDPGGYRDSWHVTTDKASHYFASSSLQLVSGDLLTCVAAGAAYEVAQSGGSGYGSRYDFGYDAAGCASAMAWRWGSRRIAQAWRR